MNTEKILKKIQLSEDFSKDIWEDLCGNVSSPHLRMNWAEIFGAFETCIEINKDSAAATETLVIPALTGTGKTLAMEYYASQLKGDTGVLIVTFLKDEVDKIVKNINQWSDKYKAYLSHYLLKN